MVFEDYDMPGIKMENSIASGGGAKTAWFKDSEGKILAIRGSHPRAWWRVQSLVASSFSLARGIRPRPLEWQARQGGLCSKSTI